MKKNNFRDFGTIRQCSILYKISKTFTLVFNYFHTRMILGIQVISSLIGVNTIIFTSYQRDIFFNFY
jgi:hypothetical protein